MPFVVRHDAVTRIGEPDGPVGMHCQVVRRVELLVLKTVHQHGDRAVVLRSRQPPRVVFAGEQPALAVPAVAVAVVRGAAEYADLSSLLAPSQNAVARNVAPQ